MNDNERKDSICSDCATRMGYEPDDKCVGIWVANCDFCGKRKPLTSLSNDWHKKGMNYGN